LRDDEEGTLAALRAVRRELGDPKIAEHRGRIVKDPPECEVLHIP
jgi:adenylate cyclase